MKKGSVLDVAFLGLLLGIFTGAIVATVGEALNDRSLWQSENDIAGLVLFIFFFGLEIFLFPIAMLHRCFSKAAAVGLFSVLLLPFLLGIGGGGYGGWWLGTFIQTSGILHQKDAIVTAAFVIIFGGAILFLFPFAVLADLVKTAIKRFEEQAPPKTKKSKKSSTHVDDDEDID